MEIPLKHKYSKPKRKGRYKSHHNDGTRRRARGPLNKKGPKTYVYGSRVLLVTASGKKVMIVGEVNDA